MPTKPEVLTRNAAKVIAALEKRDYSQPELGPETGLNVIELTRAVNYLKSQRRIEYNNGLLHLRAVDAPAPVELSTDPVSRLQDTLGAAMTTLVENGVQLAPPEPVAPAPADPVMQTSTPVIPESIPVPIEVPAIAAVIASDQEPTAPDLAEMTPAATAVQHEVDLITEIIRLKGQHAADEFEKATLRAKLDQKKRALRYVAAAGRVNAALLAQALCPSKATPVASALVLPPDRYSDANVVRYLCAGWPHLTPDEQEEIAVRLIGEIVSGNRNNAWIVLVRAVQRASESKAAVQV